MSKAKTRHIKVVRSVNNMILAVNTVTNNYVFFSTDVTESLERLDQYTSKADKHIYEWVNQTSDYAKEYFTKVVIG